MSGFSLNSFDFCGRKQTQIQDFSFWENGEQWITPRKVSLTLFTCVQYQLVRHINVWASKVVDSAGYGFSSWRNSFCVGYYMTTKDTVWHATKRYGSKKINPFHWLCGVQCSGEDANGSSHFNVQKPTKYPEASSTYYVLPTGRQLHLKESHKERLNAPANNKIVCLWYTRMSENHYFLKDYLLQKSIN